MAKIGKWEKLLEEVERLAYRFGSIPNPTAEQCGMRKAYDYIYVRMRALEKSLTKPKPCVILIARWAVGVHMQSPEARTRTGHGA